MIYGFSLNSRKMTDKTSQTTRKTIAYLRVSTLDQDIEKSKANILHFANHHDLGKAHFVEEIASGRTPWRARRIAQVLEELQTGDAIIVAELSRLGRSMLECMEILALATRKGHRRIVPEDLDAHLRQRLALGRVDLARHDRGPGLVFWQRQFAEP